MPEGNRSFLLMPAAGAGHGMGHLVRSMKLAVGNSSGYSNARVDTLEGQISQELDPAKRQAMLDEVIKIVQNDVGFIPLHQQKITWAARDNIELVQPADNSFPMRWVRVK